MNNLEKIFQELANEFNTVFTVFYVDEILKKNQKYYNIAFQDDNGNFWPVTIPKNVLNSDEYVFLKAYFRDLVEVVYVVN